MKRPNFSYAVAGVVAMITFAVYLSSLRNSFVTWDDNVYIFENPHIRTFDWSFIVWAFTSFRAGNWHPLTWISHALDYAAWGLNPLGHHLTGIILHAANTFLVGVLIIRLATIYRDKSVTDSTSSVLKERGILITGGVTAFLFGLHPLHVESVAWASERKDLLCALFYLLSIMAYVKYATHVSQGPKDMGQEKAKGIEQRADGIWTKKNNSMRYASGPLLIVLFFFVLALLSKPMAVSLPVVLLIIDWAPLNRIRSLKGFSTVLVEKLPLIACSAASSLLAYLAQKTSGSTEIMSVLPLSMRISVAAGSLFSYLGKMLLPLNLVPFYPYPRLEEIASLSPLYFLFVLFFAGVTAVSIAMAGKWKIWFAIWCFYVVTLIPVLGIVQVGGQSMADRYTYLPSIGPFLIAGLGASSILSRVQETGGRRLAKIAFAVTACGIAVSLPYLTVRQTGVWRNNLTFWNYILEREPDKLPFAYNNRGLVLQEMGQYEKASEDYRRAIALQPFDPYPYINLGAVYRKTGRTGEAIEILNDAISIEPRSIAYRNLAGVYLDTGQADKAAENSLRAIALDPGDGLAHYRLGTAYMSLGRIDDALAAYTNAVALIPAEPEVLTHLGLALARKGMEQEAIAQFQKALRLDPDYAEALFHLGNAYATAGRLDEAIENYRAAVRLEPGNTYYRNMLNKAYAGEGSFAETSRNRELR